MVVTTKATLYDKYDMIEENLKSFTRSKVRSKLLLCLLENNEMSSSDLGNELGSRITTVLHAIKELIESDLVRKSTHGNYMLTNLGKIQAYQLENAINSVIVMDNYRNFWNTHDICGIPPFLMQSIGVLAQSEIIASDNFDPLKTQNYFLEEVVNSEKIYGVSPIIMPDFPTLISALIKKESDVNLILTTDILKIAYEEYYDLMGTLINYKNLHLYCIDEIVTVAFTVTDTFLNLGLFRIDGGYDLGSDLICMGGDAIRWGMELFNYYLEKSRLITNI